MNRFFLITLLLLVLLAACSSPPKLTQPAAKVSADATLKLGQELEQRQRYQDAFQSYNAAMKQYQSFADFTGEANALAGMARISFLQNQNEEFVAYRGQIIELNKYAPQEISPLLLILNLYTLQKRNNAWQEILSLSNDDYSYLLGIRMQVLTYRLQAESYLKPGYNSQTANDLARLAARYERKMKKDFTTSYSVLTAAHYALSYHYFLLNMLPTATKHIEKSIKGDYLSENFPALGYDYWLRAQILYSQGEKASALADLMRAKSIFKSYKNEPMTLKTEAEIDRQKGARP